MNENPDETSQSSQTVQATQTSSSAGPIVAQESTEYKPKRMKFMPSRVTPPIRVINKVGRNAKCVCGSGLKFKNCCMRPGPR